MCWAIFGSTALAWSWSRPASGETRKTRSAAYSSGFSSRPELPSMPSLRSAGMLSARSSPRSCSQRAWKASEMHLRDSRPRTTCSHSAASTCPRSLSAACQSKAARSRTSRASRSEWGVTQHFFRAPFGEEHQNANPGAKALTAAGLAGPNGVPRQTLEVSVRPSGSPRPPLSDGAASQDRSQARSPKASAAFCRNRPSLPDALRNRDVRPTCLHLLPGRHRLRTQAGSGQRKQRRPRLSPRASA